MKPKLYGGALIIKPGSKFNNWTTTGEHCFRASGVFWMCICVCGTQRWVQGTRLRTKLSKSCGCQ